MYPDAAIVHTRQVPALVLSWRLPDLEWSDDPQDPIRRYRAHRRELGITGLVAGQRQGHYDHGHRADDHRQSLWRILLAGLFALVPHLRLPRPLRLSEQEARRHPGGKVGGDRPDHLALYT